jgi:hypothetical protein
MTIVIVNARVRTADPRRVADGLVVRDGVIVLVGSSAEARKLAGAEATVLDARGGVVQGVGGAGLVRGAAADLEVAMPDGALVIRAGAIVPA